MSHVFVLGPNKQPLHPVHPGGARYLLTSGKAAVYRHYPFTIILRAKVDKPAPTPLRLKIDPGAKTTGLAIVNDTTGEVVWAAELTHRGQAIKRALEERRAVRRSRRQRKTRYRKPRYAHRCRPQGWLPPSLESRVANILTWVRQLQRLSPIAALSMELVKFDTQMMENPEIARVEYQQGTLAGYEVRQYLLEKWGRQCSYCGAKEVPLQIEHIQCRARGGSNRVSNLCLACETANSEGVSAVDWGDWTRSSSHVQHQRVWVPSEPSAAAQTVLWFSDGRPGAGGGKREARVSGHACWASCGASQGDLQHHHWARQNHRCASPLLSTDRTHERL